MTKFVVAMKQDFVTLLLLTCIIIDSSVGLRPQLMNEQQYQCNHQSNQQLQRQLNTFRQISSTALLAKKKGLFFFLLFFILSIFYMIFIEMK